MRKIILLLCLLVAAPAWAQVSINTLNSGISFGSIDFSGTTGSGDITMGSNGLVNYGANTSGAGTGTAAQLEILATAGTVVTIACDTTGQLVNGVHTLTVDNLRFGIGSDQTYAADTPCAGLSTSVATYTVTATAADNTLYVGGRLVVDGQSLDNGTFSASSGTKPAFRILVQ